MQAQFLFLIRIDDLVQTTVADEAPMRQRQRRLLANDHRLHFHHLRHVIRARLELAQLDPFVDAVQQVGVKVAAVVDTCKCECVCVWMHTSHHVR